MRISVLRVVLVLGALAGCSGTPGELVPFPVDGTWAEVETLPGNAFRMTLTSSGSKVTGIGAYSGEAGPAGTLTATGTTAGGMVTLDFVLTQTLPASGPTILERFEGQVTATELRGTMTDVSASPARPPVATVFARQ